MRRLTHGVGAGIGSIAVTVFGEDGASGQRGTVLSVLGHLGDAGEAVLFAVQGWEEVDGEGGDVADVDEGDDPFKDGGFVAVVVVTEDSKSWKRC